MLPLTEILDKVKRYDPKADIDLINKAYVYSAQMHEGQKRKSGDPYFIHPVSVAGIIADMHLDSASVCAALLHDVVEDTAVTHAEIEQMFGSEVAFLVDGVTKLGRLNFTCKEDQQAESFRKMLVAMARDIRVILVKLADRLDNMRTLEHMSPESQQRIASETMEIYAPLASRLGMHWLKAELEDLSFRYLYPDAYEQLVRKVRESSKNGEKYIHEVSGKLKRMLIERGFAAEVPGRVKHLWSIYSKMKRTGCEFDQVQDFVAFRVLVESVADCYAALGVVHSEWTPVPGTFKDYVALPKPNMYQSLHTMVIGPGHRRIEVQIRTHDMHRTAEYGVAAHWRYKERTGGVDLKDARHFAWLRELAEVQKEMRDPAEFFESVRTEFFPDDVFVFTPKGHVKTFPRGSTPVDFAYSIHSEVGHHCAGARVNGAMVPLRHKLHNGDIVEIITSPNQHPSKDWLEFVVTGRARSRIRAYLHAKERSRGEKLGRDLVDREMRKRDLSLGRFLKSEAVGKALEHLHVKTIEDMFAQIGYGRISPKQFVDLVAPPGDKAEDQLRQGILERTVQKVTRRTTDEGIQIEGMDDLLVRFAKCCNPVSGDPVTGWITRGRGVTIHRRGCARALELDPERRVQVSWGGNTHMSLPVAIRVTGSDRPGILAQMSSIFTENDVNIQEAYCRTSEEGQASNVFHFAVGDVSKLNKLMRRIARLEGIDKVERL